MCISSSKVIQFYIYYLCIYVCVCVYIYIYIYTYIYIYVYIFLFRFFSIIVYYKILSIVPCAIQQVLVGYLFYKYIVAYFNPKLLIYPSPTFSPLVAIKFVFCVYAYIHLLYPFICRWTFRLLPCLGYCKQCRFEHWGACFFSNQSLHLFQIYAQEWDCWIIW